MNTGSSKANIGLLEPEKEEYMENIINLGQAFNFVKFGIMDDDGTIRKINPSSYGVTKDGRLYYLNSDGVALHQKGELHLIANSGEWEPVDMDVLTSEDPNQRWKLADSNSSSPETTKSGCYIATAVYGSYDAPQVLVLRQFRDEILAKTSAGRLFVKIYYHLSPPFAQWLNKKQRINNLIKHILDKITKHIIE